MGSYSDFLLNVFKQPEFQNTPDEFAAHTEQINTTCGDHIHLYIAQNGRLSWDGKGCMICKASAELLCRNHNQGADIKRLRSLLTPEEPKKQDADDLAALKQTLVDFPVRTKCVMLAWDAYESLPS